MKQNINIAELLKYAPVGTKLWSSAFGYVELLSVKYTLANAEGSHMHDCSEDSSIKFTFNAEDYSLSHEFGTDPFGRLYRYDECPCIIFPSKDCHTWQNFKAPWKHKHFEPFQKVLVVDNGKWTPDFYGFLDESKKEFCHYIISRTEYVADKDIIPYEGNENYLGR